MLEGFRFLVGHAAGDDQVENPGELVRRGSDPFGHSQPTFHPTTILAEPVLAVAQKLHRDAQGNHHPADDLARFGFELPAAADSVVREDKGTGQ